MAEPRNLHASHPLMRLSVTVAPLVPIEDLPPLLAREARLLGLDVGTKTIGLALSDVTRSIATPYHTMRRTKFTATPSLIQAAIEEHEVGALVIGLPINLDGSEGPRAQSTRAFARNLAARIAVPIALLGRAAFDRRRRAPSHRGRRLAQAPRRGDRPHGGGLHPARRARPAKARWRISVSPRLSLKIR